MHLDRFWNLLSKHLAGEASSEEIAELEGLIKKHPDLSYPAQHLTDLWKLPPATDAADGIDAYEKLLGRIEKAPASEAVKETLAPKPKHKTRRAVAIFLSGLALAALVWAFWPAPQKTESEKAPAQTAEISTRAGNRTRLVLPDSSIVWLNAGSRFTYDKSFGIANRNATLTGEAFFDVKKSKLPFVLRAHGIQVKVLGTAFNVKSYGNDDRTETSLLRGRVEITVDNRPGEKFVLKPNEKLSVNDRMPAGKAATEAAKPLLEWSQVTRTPERAVVETAWVENKLIFQDETLAEVARKMERWYDVSITINDPSLAALRVGGGPFENESITQALEALQLAFDFKFRKTDNQIIITR